MVYVYLAKRISRDNILYSSTTQVKLFDRYREPLSLLMLANAVMQPYLVPSWCLDIHSRKRWWTISNVSALSTVSWDIPVNEWQNSDNVGLISGLTNEWNTSTMDLSFDDTSTAGNSMISWGYPGGFFSSQVASKSIFGKNTLLSWKNAGFGRELILLYEVNI